MSLPNAERRWVWIAAVVVAALASMPYLLLWAITPPGKLFWGFVNNPDDHCVYLAWMRQAEQGHFFFQNLFTNDPQRGLTINFFFLLLGLLGRVTHVPLAVVYHLARFGFGALLLVLVYHLAAFLTEDRPPASRVPARRAAFGFTALSSGLGWLTYPSLQVRNTQGWPVDVWQPEAITFLSLYANALFCAAMAAMVGLFLGLLLAQRTGKNRYVVSAGLLGFLLGNFHSYDVITVAVVWAVYLLATGLAARRLPAIELKQAALAALIGLPSVLYQYYLLRTDPVFQARAAVPTLSPPLIKYLLGYGLLIPLAVVGIWSLRKNRSADVADDADKRSGIALLSAKICDICGSRNPSSLFLAAWALAGLAVVYIPAAFQRKLAEGLHIPIAILAAMGAVALAQRFARRPAAVQALVSFLLLLTVPTNVRFVARDVERAVTENVGSTRLHPVFWDRNDLEAMGRLEQWVPPSALLQGLPMTSTLIPAMSGRRVWAGHWGETPGFDWKYKQLVYRFFQPTAPSDWRRQFLAGTGITHLFVGSLEREFVGDTLAGEPFLRPVHRQGNTVLYQVVLDGR